MINSRFWKHYYYYYKNSVWWRKLPSSRRPSPEGARVDRGRFIWIEVSVKKKKQRPPKIIGRTEQEKTNYTSHFSVHFFAFFCTITKRKSLGKNKCQDIFLWSTSRMLSHKYVVSFLSSFSELLLVSRGLFTWYGDDFHSGMSFVPAWSSYCIHKNRMAQP